MKSSVTGVRENGASSDSQSADAVAFQPGQPFNPYGLFYGIFIPEALVRCNKLTPGAKIAYGRLVRYAGRDGVCHPRQETLAREVGVSERQVRTYLQELVGNRFLKVIRKGLHAPNEYVFLWHPVFSIAGRKETSGQDRKYSSGQERKETSCPISRESIQESHPSSLFSSDVLVEAQTTTTTPPNSAGTGTAAATATAMAPTLIQEQWQVAAAMGTSDLDAAAHLVMACRRVAPDCTAENICAFIERKRSQAKGSPIGFFLVAVPKCFTGDWRAILSQPSEILDPKRRREMEEIERGVRMVKYLRRHEDPS